MTYPKLKPYPQCGELDWLDIYTYESGWKFVECDKCYYRGPGEGLVMTGPAPCTRGQGATAIRGIAGVTNAPPLSCRLARRRRRYPAPSATVLRPDRIRTAGEGNRGKRK